MVSAAIGSGPGRALPSSPSSESSSGRQRAAIAATAASDGSVSTMGGSSVIRSMSAASFVRQRSAWAWSAASSGSASSSAANAATSIASAQQMVRVADAVAEQGVHRRTRPFWRRGALHVRHEEPQPLQDLARRPVEVSVGRLRPAVTGLPAVQRVLQALHQDGELRGRAAPVGDPLEHVDLGLGLGQAGADGRVELIEPGTVATERGPPGRRQPPPDVVVDSGVAGLGRQQRGDPLPHRHPGRDPPQAALTVPHRASPATRRPPAPAGAPPTRWSPGPGPPRTPAA